MERDEEAMARSAPSTYSWYALFILWLTIFFNYTDRQILSVLAENVKRDLRLTDGQLGMLYGTTFVVLYTVFALVLGRLADNWSRTRLMAIGMSLWSIMTALIGLAANFGQLAAARSLVGVGEATANPCASSLISDFFPVGRRALALSIYLTGMTAGTGCSALFGAWLASHWDAQCMVSGACLFKGWQVAFLVIGLAGLPVALLVALLREPKRGQSDGLAQEQTAAEKPWATIVSDFASVVPILNLFRLYQRGGTGAVGVNLCVMLLIAAGVTLLVLWTGDMTQWLGVGFIVFAISSWGQMQNFLRPAFIQSTLASRTFWYLVLGCSAAACGNATLHFWAVPYALRRFDLTLVEAGASAGAAVAIGAAVGMLAGGSLADTWQKVDRRASIWIALVCVGGMAPAIILMLAAPSWIVFMIALFVFSVIAAAWMGPMLGFFQTAVRPDMRASTASLWTLVQLSLALSLGPYTAGKISEVTGSLMWGIASVCLLCPPALILLILGARSVSNADSISAPKLRAVLGNDAA